MKAIGKYIIIEELKEDIKKTEGGLMLAESHREDIRYRKGRVTSTGTNVNGIEEGDYISVSYTHLTLPTIYSV